MQALRQGLNLDDTPVSEAGNSAGPAGAANPSL